VYLASRTLHVTLCCGAKAADQDVHPVGSVEPKLDQAIR
jgi:hypothetical protein